jgi:hypothetical protein
MYEARRAGMEWWAQLMENYQRELM